ncbi:TolC family protein [Fusibacter sp. 3D3]|uniref:TolC family protein n=1 Tax=Fusibacter sp. 3D3 TaxID=1048380 RepID=UPI0008534A6C|nr:TolC family protein [Fusibacter sp. 3D3]GAU79257.1 latent nuclear antigen [Fusibacter sp. 3D3]
MKKVNIVILMCLMMFQIVSFAGDTEIINYEDAVKILLENNSEIENLKKQIEIQKEIIIEVDNDASRLDGFVSEDEDKINERGTAVYVEPIIARNKLNNLERTLKDKEYNLKQGVLDFYVDFIKRENQIDLYKEVIEVQQKSLDQMKLKKDLGELTSDELLVYQIELEKAIKDLEKAQRDWHIKMMDFNYLINDTLVVLYTPELTDVEKVLNDSYIDIGSIDIKKITENNLANDALLADYNENIPMYEKQKFVERLDPANASAYLNYETNFKNNEFDISRRNKVIKYQVISDYDDLKNKLIDIKLAQNTLSLLKNKQETTQLKFDVGMATSLDMITVKKELKKSENDVINALNMFYKAYQDFTRYY